MKVVCLSVCLPVALSTGLALAQDCEVDLTEETADLDVEYLLSFNQVLDGGTETGIVAVCVTPVSAMRDSSARQQPALVGLAMPGPEGICSSTLSEATCDDCEWGAVNVTVAGHNVHVATQSDALCSDENDIETIGLSSSEGVLTTGALGALAFSEINVFNAEDDGLMSIKTSSVSSGDGIIQDSIDISPDGPVITYLDCYMPSNDHHARYGQGYYWEPYQHEYDTDYEFYVCTENNIGDDGVRVCAFDSGDLDNDNTVVRVIGNSLDNTIVASGGSFYPDDLRTCNSDWYYVYGWSAGWSIRVDLYGYAGRDFLAGAPDHTEYIYGGNGNDYLNGAQRFYDVDYLFGEGGYDVMHFGEVCNGSSPTTETQCAEFAGWDTWPNFTNEGDCCCYSCDNVISCEHSEWSPSPTFPEPW